ncbi:MAG: type II secretion system protein N [Thermodesulfovibrionales bacterium]
MNIRSMLIRKEALILFNSILLAIILILSLMVMRDMFAMSGGTDVFDTNVQEKDVRSKSIVRFDDYAVILKNNPFGFDAGQLSALSSHVAIKNNVPVNVNYKLIGTIATGGDDSFAIFLQSDGKQVIYRVKESIPGLGVLDEVERDKIFIRGSDGLKELDLIEIKGNGKSGVKADTGSRKAGKRKFVRKKGDGSYILNAKMVEESISNPQRLMTDARLFPRYKDGKQDGFVLKEVRKGGIYDSLGLKDGDILLRVNEYDITNPESALQAFTALSGVEKLRLDIIRNNVTISKTYHIR